MKFKDPNYCHLLAELITQAVNFKTSERVKKKKKKRTKRKEEKKRKVKKMFLLELE